MPTPDNIEEQHYFDPSYLGPETTAPPSDDLLTTLQRDANARKRGRPLGSKNKPKVDETGQMHGGPTRRTWGRSQPPPKKDEEPTVRAKLREKKQRQEMWRNKIITDWNDSMMELFMQFGVPQEFIYNDGYGPVAVDTRRYTPWGRRLAIKPLTAHTVAATLAELETSSVGVKMAAKAVEDSPLRLVFFGVASVVMVGSQVKAVLDLRNELAPYVEAWQRAKENERQRRKNAQQRQEQEEPISGLA